jgi:hypothetical protein
MCRADLSRKDIKGPQQSHSTHTDIIYIYIIKGSLGGETSVLRTFRMSGKELVKELAKKELVKETVSQRKS